MQGSMTGKYFFHTRLKSLCLIRRRYHRTVTESPSKDWSVISASQERYIPSFIAAFLLRSQLIYMYMVSIKIPPCDFCWYFSSAFKFLHEILCVFQQCKLVYSIYIEHLNVTMLKIGSYLLLIKNWIFSYTSLYTVVIYFYNGPVFAHPADYQSQVRTRDWVEEKASAWDRQRHSTAHGEWIDTRQSLKQIKLGRRRARRSMSTLCPLSGPPDDASVAVYGLQTVWRCTNERSVSAVRFGFSHWDLYAVHRGGCLELYYCNTVEWSWWDSSLICKTNWFPSVLWQCWFGHMTCKNRPRYDL